MPKDRRRQKLPEPVGGAICVGEAPGRGPKKSSPPPPSSERPGNSSSCPVAMASVIAEASRCRCRNPGRGPKAPGRRPPSGRRALCTRQGRRRPSVCLRRWVRRQRGRGGRGNAKRFLIRPNRSRSMALPWTILPPAEGSEHFLGSLPRPLRRQPRRPGSSGIPAPCREARSGGPAACSQDPCAPDQAPSPSGAPPRRRCTDRCSP